MVVAARAGQQGVVLVKKVEKNDDDLDPGHDPDPDLEVDQDAKAV